MLLTHAPAAPWHSGTFALGTLILLLAASACSGDVPKDSACTKLVYTNAGVARADYMPCAGEIMAALDELAPQADAAMRGDRQARSDGEATLRRVHALMKAAGGRNLLERWSDATLTSMNVQISNTVTKYDAFYMIRILDDPNPYAAKSREAAQSELSGAQRAYADARRLYLRLR
jgi:hypothetical protein